MTSEDVAEQVADSDWTDRAARVGLVAYGIVHLLVALIAVQLAFGERTGKASSQGAMAKLSGQPLGAVAVWAMALGLVLLVVWRVIEASVGHRDREQRTRARVVSALKAVLYAAVAWSALKISLGDHTSGGSDSMTASVMNAPGGQVIVGLAALAILGYAAFTIRRGVTDAFMEHLDAEGSSGDGGRLFRRFGEVGYVGKGASIVLVGVLVMIAAWTHDPAKSGGLDAGLLSLLGQPFGPVLVGVVGLGLGCYGLFCFARARHLDR